MTFPTFAAGEVLGAADMNAVGLWRVTNCTVSSAGGTAATASNGVVTVGTGNTSVTVNNAFSTNYDNYRIVVTGIAGSVGGVSLALQLNNSTGSTYLIGGIFASFGSTTLNGYGPAATVRWTDIFALDTVTQGATADIFQPFQVARTTFASNTIRTGTGQNAWYYMTGVDTNAVSNTGFIISPIAGTITGGQIRVYGYNK